MKINILSKKQQSDFQKFASATIIQDENGSYNISTKDTARGYLLCLVLNKLSILLKNDIDLQTLEIKNQHTDFYQFNTSTITKFIEYCKKYNFFITTNIKQGDDGNRALAYYSLSKDNKLINKYQYNIINKSKIIILLEKSSEYSFIEINDIEDWNFFLTNIINDYTPIRLIFKNCSPSESGEFYLKPVNAMLKKTYDKLVEKYCNKHNLVSVSSANLRLYGINISDNLSKNDGVSISNERFFAKFQDDILEKVCVIEKPYLRFPFETESANFYDEYSFVKNKYFLTKENPIIEIVDIMTIFADQNRNECENVNPLTAFLRKNTNLILKRIEDIIETSNKVLLNDADGSLKSKLISYYKSENKNQIFFITKDSNNNPIVKINRKEISEVEIHYYDRDPSTFKVIPKDNIENQIKYFSVIKEGLSFEREKTSGVFFIEDFVKKLKNNGHINIEVYLEKPCKKSIGSGHLDFFVKSEKNGKIYGQVFEFKAIFGQIKKEHEDQAENYKIIKLIDELNITNSYDLFEGNYNCNEVKLLNLITNNEAKLKNKPNKFSTEIELPF